MPKGRKHKWQVGDVFTIRQKDGNYTICQILDQPMPNIVSLVATDIRVAALEDCQAFDITPDHALSYVATDKWPLVDGEWQIVGHQEVVIPQGLWPNEKHRASEWVGSRHYDAGLLEDFLDSYYGLAPWDIWYDPNFLDEFLSHPSRKPKKLWLTKSQQ